MVPPNKLFTLGLRERNLSRKADSDRLWMGSPAYTSGTPASKVRAMADTDGCACCLSAASSQQHAVCESSQKPVQ